MLIRGTSLLRSATLSHGVAVLRADTSAAGPIEVEVINRDLWRLPGDELVALTCERFVAAV